VADGQVYPEPDERPTRRAQWDEIHGRWLEWDASANDWQVVEDVYGGEPQVAADAPDAQADGPAWVPGEGQSLDDIE
jgi:hypothetical protein